MPRFEKGNSFGTGRPKGSPNKSTSIFEEIGHDGVAKVIRKVHQQATRGSLRAAALLLARTWPRRRGRPVLLDLPPVETAEGMVQAHAAVVAQMAAGELTPEEASAVGNVLEMQRRALETYDHEKRIQALEDKRREGPNPFERAAAA
jgi:hypothetical protein